VFLDVLGVDSILGVDISPGVVDVARRDHGSPRVDFTLRDERQPDGRFDLAFTNGVFHHIPRDEHAGAAAYVFRALRRGGWFAFWENNPWNPGTRYVMSRCAFDRDAVTVAPRTARRLLNAAGFEVLRTDFLFLFPRSLRSLRSLEPLLAGWPIGAQYQVLCRKP
jgi:SAM-dependent methyltransferase